MKTFVEEVNWDFYNQQTHSYTNGFHKYPAMMVPGVVDKLIQDYGRKGGVFLDPFCGTGRSLLAARMACMNSIGLDVNPLAVLITTVKLRMISPRRLTGFLKNIIEYYESSDEITQEHYPTFWGREFWFSEIATRDLTRLTNAIRKVFPRNCYEKDFFYVVLSETIRSSSWTRKSEFKLYRMPEDARKIFSPDIRRLFETKAKRNIEGMKQYWGTAGDGYPEYYVLKADARTLCENVFLRRIIRHGVDLVITSPPYGDSRTTVQYGEFSRLSLQWLQMDKNFASRWGFTRESDIMSINQRCLGGITQPQLPVLLCSLQKYVDRIALLSISRAKHVLSFYGDLYKSLQNVTRVLSSRGHLILLVANRTVKGVEVRMNEILVDFGNELGLRPEKVIQRNIIGKMLPRKINTNSKDIGCIKTMLKEYIMIFSKDC